MVVAALVLLGACGPANSTDAGDACAPMPAEQLCHSAYRFCGDLTKNIGLGERCVTPVHCGDCEPGYACVDGERTSAACCSLDRVCPVNGKQTCCSKGCIAAPDGGAGMICLL